jgi:hypothetical protein
VKVVAHDDMRFEINSEEFGQMKQAFFQPGFAVVVFFSAGFIVAT